mgnify:CR=1 FL=1
MNEKEILDYDLEDLLFLEIDDFQYENTAQQINLDGWLDFLLNGLRQMTTPESYAQALTFLAGYSEQLKNLEDADNIFQELSTKCNIGTDQLVSSLEIAVAKSTKKYLQNYLNTLQQNIGDSVKDRFAEINKALNENDFNKYFDQMELLMSETTEVETTN